MNYDPIIVIAGEPNSIFIEIFLKSLKKKIKSPIILIASYDLIKQQMKKLSINKEIQILEYDKLKYYKLNNKKINLLNVNYNFKKPFENISSKSNEYIKKSFKLGFKIIKSGFSKKFINGPISKKHFLKKKYLGVTEYISEIFSVKKTCMLIYNKQLSVSPVTTHLPLKLVTKKISQQIIYDKVLLIQKFYKKFLSKEPKIGVLGINPHCESVLKTNEDEEIIMPVVSKIKKKGLRISGPLSADTMFLKNNRKKFDVIIGMYHDQVLTPIKTLFEYDAINITLGLPFIRVSPDHGPNEKMMGQNKSNPNSLIEAIKFLDKH